MTTFPIKKLSTLNYMLQRFALLAATGVLALGISISSALASGSTIVDTAVDAGKFKTLVIALEAADLVETLKGKGPFTVFAPTDEAFAKLPAGTIDSLLKPENKDKLVAVLTYHVVPGKIMSADLVGKKIKARTVQGRHLTVDAVNGVVINDAKVVSADITTSNGVIHIVDKVLLPK